MKHLLRSLGGVAPLLMAAACGGGTAAPNPPPPPPPTPVASVSVTPSTQNLVVGTTAQLSATPRDPQGNALAGRAVAWSSSEDAIATVSSTGLVSAASPGAATITATSESTSGGASVTVIPVPVASVVVALGSSSVTVGQTTQATVTLRDADGNTLTGRVVTWTSSAPAVATVAATGLVTAVAPGITTVTATGEGKSGSAVLTVALPPVAVVTVSLASSILVVGQTTQAAASLRDGSGNVLTGRAVTWGTSNAAIATVSSTGLVTAASPGAATITATNEGTSGGASVTVIPVPVASVVVALGSSSVTVGQTTQAAASLRDGSGNVLTGRAVTWGTSDAAIATVSSTGLVTAASPGIATITATSEGTSGGASVTVIPVPVASVVVALGSSSVTVRQTTQAAASLRDGNGNVLTGRAVTWGTSNAAIATVSSTGLVTAASPGTVTITATSEGTSGGASVTVIPANFIVNSTPDAVDADPGDGVCATAIGACSLRAAIMEANALPGDDSITLPAGTYLLTIAGVNEEAGATGDLDITSNLIINGAGAVNTIIDGNGSVVKDRVFHIVGAFTVAFSRVTIRGGDGNLAGAPGAGFGGDGIFNAGGTVTLTNSTISGNTGPAAAGILNAGTMTISNSIVSGNSAFADGGGIMNRGPLTLTASRVTGNTAGRGLGGGIFNEQMLVLTNSTVSNNEGGGIYNHNTGTIILENSTLSNNTSFRGAGIRNTGSLTITNSTFSNNSAREFGGGIFNSSGIVTVTNSTFSGNAAISGAGGIGNFTGTTTLRNTLVANNPSGGNCAGTITNGGGNLSWPDITCPGLNADPLIGTLANNGGPTETHALATGSAAIDMAVNANCPATDQRGVARPQSQGCDIGAFELQAPTSLEVAIDIQPTSFPNTSNPGSREWFLWLSSRRRPLMQRQSIR